MTTINDATIAVLNYDDHQIPMRVNADGSHSWSLTAMGRVFGKRTNDWVSNEQTQALLAAIADANASDCGGNSRHDLIEVNQRGEHAGTWTSDKTVALAYAAWINPAFHVWMLKQIITLTEQGKVEITTDTVLDLKVGTIVGHYNNGRNFGKALKGMLKHLTNHQLDHIKIQDTLDRIIRGIRGDYRDKDRFFRLLDANVYEFFRELPRSKRNDIAQATVLAFVEDRWRAYRGKVIGQRSRHTSGEIEQAD